MKRDVTKIGKRTKKGALDDALSGAKRYFVNNYKDTEKQAGIDLLLGEESEVRLQLYPPEIISLSDVTCEESEFIQRTERYASVEYCTNYNRRLLDISSASSG